MIRIVYAKYFAFHINPELQPQLTTSHKFNYQNEGMFTFYIVHFYCLDINSFLNTLKVEFSFGLSIAGM